MEEVRGVEGGGGGEEGLEGGVWRRIRLVDGGREGGDYRIPKNSEERNSGDERELDWWSVEALSNSSRNMVESGDASSRRLCAPGRARWHLWACTRALGAVVGKRCAREAGDCRDGRRRRHSSSRSQALTLGLFRCGTLDSRESASGAGRIDTSEAARCALCGEAFSA